MGVSNICLEDQEKFQEGITWEKPWKRNKTLKDWDKEGSAQNRDKQCIKAEEWTKMGFI